MTRLESLLRHAIARHGIIYPASGRPWEQCLTLVEGVWALWYNDEHGSTHMVREGIDSDTESCYNSSQEESNDRH